MAEPSEEYQNGCRKLLDEVEALFDGHDTRIVLGVCLSVVSRICEMQGNIQGAYDGVVTHLREYQAEIKKKEQGAENGK